MNAPFRPDLENSSFRAEGSSDPGDASKPGRRIPAEAWAIGALVAAAAINALRLLLG